MAGISFSYADSDHFRFLRRVMKRKTWSLPPSVPSESRPEFNVSSEWIQRPYDDEAVCGAMRRRKTSGKFRNAKHDPASYTGEAQENRCRQRPSAKREKIIIRRARTEVLGLPCHQPRAKQTHGNGNRASASHGQMSDRSRKSPGP